MCDFHLLENATVHSTDSSNSYWNWKFKLKFFRINSRCENNFLTKLKKDFLYISFTFGLLFFFGFWLQMFGLLLFIFPFCQLIIFLEALFMHFSFDFFFNKFMCFPMDWNSRWSLFPWKSFATNWYLENINIYSVGRKKTI